MPDATTAAARLVLAFDFGRRRIGIACGDTFCRTATALAGIDNGAGGPRWEGIEALLREWQPALLVVGLPYNADGSESPMSGQARDFAAALCARTGLPVRLVDERFSSLEAETRLKSLRAEGLRKRRVVKGDIDAAAACIILERWFSELSRGDDAITT